MTKNTFYAVCCFHGFRAFLHWQIWQFWIEWKSSYPIPRIWSDKNIPFEKSHCLQNVLQLKYLLVRQGSLLTKKGQTLANPSKDAQQIKPLWEVRWMLISHMSKKWFVWRVWSVINCPTGKQGSYRRHAVVILKTSASTRVRRYVLAGCLCTLYWLVCGRDSANLFAVSHMLHHQLPVRLSDEPLDTLVPLDNETKRGELTRTVAHHLFAWKHLLTADRYRIWNSFAHRRRTAGLRNAAAGAESAVEWKQRLNWMSSWPFDRQFAELTSSSSQLSACITALFLSSALCSALRSIRL